MAGISKFEKWNLEFLLGRQHGSATTICEKNIVSAIQKTYQLFQWPQYLGLVLLSCWAFKQLMTS